MTMFIGDMPAITDADLQTLLAKARRLGRIGDNRQKAAAAELLPAVQELIDARRTMQRDLIEARKAAARRALH
jgi:hypothetical protein